MESYLSPATAREIACEVGVSTPKAEALLMNLCKENKVKEIKPDDGNGELLYVISTSDR